ncbi:hypothetical protein MKX03_037929 [Papaver bracteatum]|nr:hypothetical protein MKX03_037929 [Papaver bracteatum]
MTLVVPMSRIKGTLVLASRALDGGVLSCDSKTTRADKDVGDSVICTEATNDFTSVGRWYEEDIKENFWKHEDYVIIHAGFHNHATEIVEYLESDMMDLRADNVKVDFSSLHPRLISNFHEVLRENVNNPIATYRIKNTAYVVAALSEGDLEIRSYSYSGDGQCLEYSLIEEFDCVGSGAPCARTTMRDQWNTSRSMVGLVSIHQQAMKAANNVEASVGGIHTYMKVWVDAGELYIEKAEMPIVDLYRILRLDKSTNKYLGRQIRELNIEYQITKALAERGITDLHPVQRLLSELVCTGRDIIARARTGTGKNLAFGIPIMNQLIQFLRLNTRLGKLRKRKEPLALVLAPTSDLAREVEQEFHKAARDLDLMCVHGGEPRRMNNVVVDVLVGTPESIDILMNRDNLKLSELQFIVLVEADNMQRFGFNEVINTILAKLPFTCQRIMMARASMSPEMWKLTQNHLRR